MHPTGGQPSFADTLKTVIAGALGVRRRADHDRSGARLNPVHLIIAGLVAAALFVLTLVAVVRWVVAAA